MATVIVIKRKPILLIFVLIGALIHWKIKLDFKQNLKQYRIIHTEEQWMYQNIIKEEQPQMFLIIHGFMVLENILDQTQCTLMKDMQILLNKKLMKLEKGF